MKTLPRLLAVSVTLFASAAHGAKPVEIRLGTILPSGTPQHALLEELGERWRKDTAGAVKLTLYPDGRLGGEGDMVAKLRIRQINAGLFTAVGLSEIDPAVAGLQIMPLMFRSWPEVDYVREKMRPLLESRLRAKGFEVLFWADAGWVRFFSKAPAVRPDDLRAMKLFTWAGNEQQVALMRSIGCQPVPLATSDIVFGLTTNLFNAVPMPPMVALASQLQDRAPNMIELKWSPIVGATIVQLAVWEKIPAADRARLRIAADAIGEKIRARGRLEDEEAIRVMGQRGLRAHPLTPQAVAEWNTLAAELHPKIRGNLVPAEIFDAVEKHLRDFRAAHLTATP